MPKKKIETEEIILGPDINPDIDPEGVDSQTDLDINNNPEAGGQDLDININNNDSGQTDIEDVDKNAKNVQQSSASEILEPDLLSGQTDSDNLKDNGLAELPEIITNNTENQSDETNNMAQPEGSPVTPNNSTRQSGSSSRRRKAEAAVSNTPIVAIDDERSVETIEDKLRNDILDLVESMKGRKILTGTIQGVERSDENADVSYAVLYHGEFKVIIPAQEAVNPPEDYRGRSPADVLHYMITKRLGAEIDYIVKGVDPKTGIAGASRLEAMAKRRKDYYYGTDRDGNNLLYEGGCAEARIVSVIRAGIFVDLFGVEIYIPLRELSYQRWMDADSHFQPGQRVLVKILSLDKSDRNNIKVSASVKQAGENPYEKALRKYAIGSRYVGTVSMVDTNGVFVSLDGGIDCLCSYPKRGRPPRGSRVTVRIIGINHQSNRIWGAITHMSLAR